jgi:hypothetical protein
MEVGAGEGADRAKEGLGPSPPAETVDRNTFLSQARPRPGFELNLLERRPRDERRGGDSRPKALATLIVGAVFRIEATPVVLLLLLWFGAIQAMRRSRTGAFDEALERVVRRLEAGHPSPGRD